ncbi:MAG: gamma-glutamylcyclotransferase [Alphaproteobacteria bacterium]
MAKESPPPYAALRPRSGGWLYVFVYGSLIWNPGFNHERARAARIYGYHRDLSLFSVHYRGTRRHPGLVCGLDYGGSCVGFLYETRPEKSEETLDYLWRREMIQPDVYRPVYVRCHTRRRVVSGMTFVLNREHPHYAGNLSDDERIAIVQRARGRNGSSQEYLRKTNESLIQAGIPCPRLQNLQAKLKASRQKH